MAPAVSYTHLDVYKRQAKAIELNPEDLTYRAELAVVNLRVGRYEEALNVLKTALEDVYKRQGINRAVFATADDELRPVMNGIYFDITTEDITMAVSYTHLVTITIQNMVWIHARYVFRELFRTCIHTIFCIVIVTQQFSRHFCHAIHGTRTLDSVLRCLYMRRCV